MDQTTAPPTGQSTGEQMQDKAKDAAGQTQEKAKEAAGQVQEKAQQGAQQAKSQLRTQVDQRSTQAGEKVTGTASDIRTIAQQLREQGKDQPAKLAERAADHTERVGGYLTDSSADRILDDAESYARRQPWAVAAGGALLGFAASRFLKASSRERYEQRSPRPAGAGAVPEPTAGATTAPVAQPDPAFDRLVPTDQVVPGATTGPTPPIVATDDVATGTDRGGVA